MISPVRGWFFLTVVFLPYKHWVAKGGREILTRRTEVPQRIPDAQRTPKYSINPEGEQPVVRRGSKMECPTGPGTRSRPGWNPAPLPGDSGEPSAELTERGRTIAISRPEERGQREARKSGGWLPLTTRPQCQEIIKNDFACPGLVSDHGIFAI